ncbi:MAG TPA: NUDIX domain-containing protein [Candidatus Saccharimonadales bacterium]|nr:NUDIX domain-containing protein [Candidatus Saccharimonadales bacterium]
MKYEFSAGGVVYNKESDNLFILVAQHSQHHGWVFPKGFIGDKIEGESKEATAIREVEEETGVIGKILEPLTPVTYWYQMDGEKRKKTVYYYIMQFIKGDITKHDWEMENVEWLPMNEVETRLTYPSDKKVWKEAKTRIVKM